MHQLPHCYQLIPNTDLYFISWLRHLVLKENYMFCTLIFCNVPKYFSIIFMFLKKRFFWTWTWSQKNVIGIELGVAWWINDIVRFTKKYCLAQTIFYLFLSNYNVFKLGMTMWSTFNWIKEKYDAILYNEFITSNLVVQTLILEPVKYKKSAELKKVKYLIQLLSGQDYPNIM